MFLIYFLLLLLQTITEHLSMLFWVFVTIFVIIVLILAHCVGWINHDIVVGLRCKLFMRLFYCIYLAFSKKLSSQMGIELWSFRLRAVYSTLGPEFERNNAIQFSWTLIIKIFLNLEQGTKSL